MKLKIDKEKERVVGNSNDPQKIKDKTIKSLKSSRDFIFSNSDAEVSIVGGIFETSLSFMALIEKLTKIFTREELVYLIDFVEKNKNAKDIDDVKEEDYKAFEDFVKQIENRLMRSDDLSTK